MSAISVISDDRTLVKIGGNIVRANRNGDWKQVIAAYLSQKDCSKESLRSYSKALTQYFHWISNTGRTLATLDESDIIAWKEYLYATHHAVMTVALYIVSVKGFYHWAEANKLYPDIARNIKSASRRDKSKDDFIKYHLTDEQSVVFLDHFRNSGNLRDYALMNLMIRTGLRSIEVFRANCGDIHCENGRRLLYIQGKGRRDKNDFVVISEKAYGPLKTYLDTRKELTRDTPLFVCEGRNCRGRRLSARMIQKVGKDGLRAIGLDDHKYSVHSLRHTAGVAILKHGGTQFDVQDVLRHSSPVTSQIYLQSIKKERRLEAAPEMLIDNAF